MGRLIILITLLLLPITAVGEDVVKPDAVIQAEIISVIESQIAAFRRDDAVAAFSFASRTGYGAGRRGCDGAVADGRG